MFEFFKNYEQIITILTIVLIIVLIFLFIKFEFLRIAVVTILSVLYTLISIYCGYQVNNYYASTGGIIGELTNIVKPNQVVVQELKINLKYSEFTLKDDGKYSLETSTNSPFDLTSETNYIVLVNGKPCSKTLIDKDFISAEYTYSFLNSDLEEVLVDTLYIKVGFHNTSTIINVYTFGDSTAVDYWNNYFNLNDFVIEVKENPVSVVDIPVENEYFIAASQNFACVRFFNDTDLIVHKDYVKGSNISAPALNVPTGYKFIGWIDSATGEIIDLNSFVVNSDTNLVAKFEVETYVVNLYVNDSLVETINVEYGTAVDSDSFNYEIPAGYKLTAMHTSSDYVFVNPATNKIYVSGNADLTIYKSAGLN